MITRPLTDREIALVESAENAVIDAQFMMQDAITKSGKTLIEIAELCMFSEKTLRRMLSSSGHVDMRKFASVLHVTEFKLKLTME